MILGTSIGDLQRPFIENIWIILWTWTIWQYWNRMNNSLWNLLKTEGNIIRSWIFILPKNPRLRSSLQRVIAFPPPIKWICNPVLLMFLWKASMIEIDFSLGKQPPFTPYACFGVQQTFISNATFDYFLSTWIDNFI